MMLKFKQFLEEKSKSSPIHDEVMKQRKADIYAKEQGIDWKVNDSNDRDWSHPERIAAHQVPANNKRTPKKIH